MTDLNKPLHRCCSHISVLSQCPIVLRLRVVSQMCPIRIPKEKANTDHAPLDSWRRRRKMERKERWNGVAFNTNAYPSVLHVHISNPSRSMVPQWSRRYPGAQVELEGCTRECCSRLLIKEPNLEGSRTTWGSRSLLRIGGWLFNRFALQMKLESLGTQYFPSPRMLISLLLCVSCASRGWFRTRVRPSPSDWLSTVNQLGGERWASSFDPTSW